MIPGLILAVTLAAIIFGIWGAVEARNLTTTSLRQSWLQNQRKDRAGIFLQGGVKSLEPESRTVGLEMAFTDPVGLRANRVVVTSLEPGADPKVSLPLSAEQFYFRGRNPPNTQTDSEPSSRAQRVFMLTAWGGPFLYPFDTYSLCFAVNFHTEDGGSYDSSEVPMGGGFGPGFMGFAINDTIAGIRTLWSAETGDGITVYRVDLRRLLFLRVLFVVLFSLTAVAMVTGVCLSQDRTALLAVGAGVIGTTWAVRSIVLEGNAFRSPTLVDVAAYFIILVTTSLIALMAWRLPS